MSLLIRDRSTSKRVIARRRALGLDRYDEVWNGVYVMSPLPNNEHQIISTRFVYVLSEAVPLDEGTVFAGANVSDRVKRWKKNYRIPDVCVYLVTTSARDCGTHWLGGPDWLTEILSLGESPRKKLQFYEKIKTREVLVVHRDPWRIELYQLQDEKLALAGYSDLNEPNELKSGVLPLSIQLISGTNRPFILVRHTDGSKEWRV
jgi:Uma2 family endonuclease